jgi:hypothetical protein
MKACKFRPVKRMALCMTVVSASVLGSGQVFAGVSASLTATPALFAAGSTTDLILDLTAIADPNYFNATLGSYALSLDFGDGSAAAVLNGNGSNSQVTVSHTYALPGSYTAMLSGNANYSQDYYQSGYLYTEYYSCGFFSTCSYPVYGIVGIGTQYSSSPISTSTALSVASVPEPEIYGMLLAGLGLVGAVAQRRKQSEA